MLTQDRDMLIKLLLNKGHNPDEAFSLADNILALPLKRSSFPISPMTVNNVQQVIADKQPRVQRVKPRRTKNRYLHEVKELRLSLIKAGLSDDSVATQCIDKQRSLGGVELNRAQLVRTIYSNRLQYLASNKIVAATLHDVGRHQVSIAVSKRPAPASIGKR